MYTRDRLAAAAAESSSMVDLMRRLGATLGSGSRGYLNRRLRHYGIDTSHFREEPLPERERRSYSKELLAKAAAHSHSIREVLEYMGLPPRDSPYGHVRKKLDHYGIDTSHFTRGRRYGAGILVRDDLVAAVEASFSLAGTLRLLGRVDNGAGRALVKRSIEAHGISTEHFTGQGHFLGASSPYRKPAQEILRRLDAPHPGQGPPFCDVHLMIWVSRTSVPRAASAISGGANAWSWRSTTSTATGSTTAARTCDTCVRPATARPNPSRTDVAAHSRVGARVRTPAG